METIWLFVRKPSAKCLLLRTKTLLLLLLLLLLFLLLFLSFLSETLPLSDRKRGTNGRRDVANLTTPIVRTAKMAIVRPAQSHCKQTALGAGREQARTGRMDWLDRLARKPA